MWSEREKKTRTKREGREKGNALITQQLTGLNRKIDAVISPDNIASC